MPTLRLFLSRIYNRTRLYDPLLKLPTWVRANEKLAASSRSRGVYSEPGLSEGRTSRHDCLVSYSVCDLLYLFLVRRGRARNKHEAMFVAFHIGKHVWCVVACMGSGYSCCRRMLGDAVCPLWGIRLGGSRHRLAGLVLQQRVSKSSGVQA